MSTIGFPDGQRITQWLGAPIVQAAGLVIGNVLHEDGPFNLASWASVIVAVKAAGGNVTATVRQKVSGGPAALELDTTFVVPAGTTVFEAVVLFGDTVLIDLTGSAPGVSVDYAVYPSNTTTNAQVLASAVLSFQHNDALVALESALDLEDAAGVLNWTLADDAPNTRVKLTPIWAASLQHPGDIYANQGAAGQVRLSGAAGVPTIYLGSALDTNLYRSGAAILKTDGALHVVQDSSAQRGSVGQTVIGAVGPSAQAGVVFGSALDTNLYRSGAASLKTDGTLIAGSDLYTTGAGATRVGFLDPGGSSGGTTYVGIGYDATNTRATFGALTGGVAWRDVLVGRGGGYMLAGTGIKVGASDANFDTNLYRKSASVLKTDSGLRVGSSLTANDGGTNQTLLETNGAIYFGIAADTNLYRAAANTLKTDGGLRVGGKLLTAGLASYTWTFSSPSGTRDANGTLGLAADVAARLAQLVSDLKDLSVLT